MCLFHIDQTIKEIAMFGEDWNRIVGCSATELQISVDEQFWALLANQLEGRLMKIDICSRWKLSKNLSCNQFHFIIPQPTVLTLHLIIDEDRESQFKYLSSHLVDSTGSLPGMISDTVQVASQLLYNTHEQGSPVLLDVLSDHTIQSKNNCDAICNSIGEYHSKIENHGETDEEILISALIRKDLKEEEISIPIEYSIEIDILMKLAKLGINDHFVPEEIESDFFENVNNELNAAENVDDQEIEILMTIASLNVEDSFILSEYTRIYSEYEEFSQMDVLLDAFE